MDVKVIIATHKKYDMPKDEMYVPLHVGREGKDDLGYVGDNTGDNISIKNPKFCELTGLYWAWKNLDAEYLGLAHYRRHFTLKKKSQRKKLIATFHNFPILRSLRALSKVAGNETQNSILTAPATKST